MKRFRTWVVVADAETARLLESDHAGAGLTAGEADTLHWPSLREQEVFSDRPGRSYDSAGAGRHAMERPSSAKEQGLQSFSKAIAARLAKGNESQLFDRLVLVAAPKLLGELRRALPRDVARLIVAQLPKDLTKAAPEEIVRALEDSVRL